MYDFLYLIQTKFHGNLPKFLVLKAMNHSFEIIRDIFARTRVSRAWLDWSFVRIWVWTPRCDKLNLEVSRAISCIGQTAFRVTAHYWFGKFVGYVWYIAEHSESNDETYYQPWNRPAFRYIWLQRHFNILILWTKFKVLIYISLLQHLIDQVTKCWVKMFHWNRSILTEIIDD